MRGIFLRAVRGPRRGSRLSAIGGLALAAAIAFGNVGSAAAVVTAATDDQARSATGVPDVPAASCPGGQCFADVPPSNPFYAFANRIYLQGLVSGYVCGGPAEPCDAESRPYYRPAVDVTRQQMAKFIDNARRLPEIHIETSTGDPPVYVRNDASNAIYAQAGDATAIVGYSTGGSSSVGVYGVGNLGIQGLSSTGIGVRGTSSAADNYGVVGEASGANGIGVFGRADSGGDAVGVYGRSATGTGVAGNAMGIGRPGVYGYGAHGFGVRGEGGDALYAGVGGESYATDGIGVWGQASTGSSSSGVYGYSYNGVGVRGGTAGTSVAGVYGYATGGGHGVLGQTSAAAGYGVYGFNSAPGGVAGYFQGDAQVTGSLSKGAGSFKIDHPLDPENQYLYHSFVESPDMMNIYNGNVTTDARGEAVVTMPEWFEALNRDFRYQLTPIGQFADAIVSSKIKDNRFTIRTDKAYVEVSWMVTGIRKDPYAEQHRIPVEEEKNAEERGKYLHPAEWGQPESDGIGYEARNALDTVAPYNSTGGK